MTIREMSVDDLKISIAWAAEEGWNPGLHDAETFHSADPHGFLIAAEGDVREGSVSAVAYDDSYGFIGLFIVRNDLRGHHIGVDLGTKALQYLGNRCVGQDGVLKKVKNYGHYGFKMAYRNIRFQGISMKAPVPQDLIVLSKIPFDEICRYDRLHFPADRKIFLGNWISQPDSLALGSLGPDKRLTGYGVIRKCIQGFKIGPLFADSDDIAEKLFVGLANFAGEGEPFFLDAPEVNAGAMEITKSFQMKEVFSTARMYLNGTPELPLDRIFGVTTFELG